MRVRLGGRHRVASLVAAPRSTRRAACRIGARDWRYGAQLVKWVWIAVAAAALALAGCGSGDSTVVQDTGADARHSASDRAAAPPPRSSAAPSTAAPDPCAVNLAAPEIAKAVSELPRDPRSGQAWSPEPLAGTYNECAQLSAVIVKANTNADEPQHPRRAVPPRQVHSDRRAGHLRVQRHRQIGQHRRHRRAACTPTASPGWTAW